MRSGRVLAVALGLGAAACGVVDVGDPLADVNACRPSQRFFYERVWPEFLNKDFGGKRCNDSGCHDAASGQALMLPTPSAAPTLPLPLEWDAIYRSATEQLFCNNVAASPLLARPDGRMTHGGQKLIDPDGPEATLIKMWVSAP